MCDETTIACCECCAPTPQPVTQPGAVPAAPSPVPEPPATAPAPSTVPPAPPGSAATAGQAISSWPVRVPLANGSWVWMTVPWPTPVRDADPAVAAPSSEPIGHDATRTPGTG